MQDMDDGYGQQMYKTVEKYADNQRKNSILNKKALTWYDIVSFNPFTELWIRDFIKVWIKMSQNGYGSKELVQGPKNFWTHF